MDLTSDKQRPLYKRWTFYVWSVLAAAAALFFCLILSVFVMRWVNPAATSFTLQENWSELEADRYNLREWWVPYDEIPEHLKWAVIAAEDQLFWDHRGFDMESIREAWRERQEGRRSRGASTISQQVAKNLYLWPAHSFFRKGLEAGITVLIELFWPKERVLEVYLNIVEFGPGVFGVGKASDVFFNKPVALLAPEMSARLASVLPSPKRMRVEPPSPYALERSRWVLHQMTQLSGIAYVPLEESPAADEDPLMFDGGFLLDDELDMMDGEHPDTLFENRDGEGQIRGDTLIWDFDIVDTLIMDFDTLQQTDNNQFR